jgi:hypothetical protein
MIHYQTWPLQAILVSDWPIFQIFSFEKKSTNQKQELYVVAMFANRSGRNEQSS